MAGVPSVASTKETTNYARLCRLLVDIGSQALRDTFDGIHAPATLHTVLASHPVRTSLQDLFRRKKILNPAQWGKLYPAIASSVSSSTFDITLLMVLLRNICGLTPPATGWDALAPDTDKSREADIARLKYFRNTVYAHAEQARVDDVTFNTHWQNIRDVLVRLGGAKYGDAIDKLKTECMDPDVEEHYKELLQQWKKDEYIIKDQLQEMGNDIKSIKEMGNDIKYIKEALRVAIDKPESEDIRLKRGGEKPELHPSISSHKSNEMDTKEKCSKRQEGDASSHGNTKGTNSERNEASNNSQPDFRWSHATAPADQNTSRPPKFSVSSKKNSGRRYATSRVNTEQLHVNDHDLYGVSPEGSQFYGETQHNLDARFSTGPPAGSAYDATQHNLDLRYSMAPTAGSVYDVKQLSLDARYGETQPQAGSSQYPGNTKGTQRRHTAPQAGHPQYYDNTKERMDAATNQSCGIFVRDDPRRYGVASQSGPAGVIADTYGYQSKMSARAETQVHGSAFGDPRYVNLRDINSFAYQPIGSAELFTKDSARRHDDRRAKFVQSRGSGAEPMDVEQIDRRGVAFSRYNEMAEAAYAKATGHSDVTELNAPIKRQLSLQPGDGLSGKASEQLSSAPTEHRRQYGSESTASAQESQTTRSRDGTTREAQPSRSLSSTKEVGQKIKVEEKEWSCSRCTFLNPPDHKICAMCGTTLGVGSVKLTEAGIRVCSKCTLLNMEIARACEACHTTL